MNVKLIQVIGKNHLYIEQKTKKMIFTKNAKKLKQEERLYFSQYFLTWYNYIQCKKGFFTYYDNNDNNDVACFPCLEGTA